MLSSLDVVPWSFRAERERTASDRRGGRMRRAGVVPRARRSAVLARIASDVDRRRVHVRARIEGRKLASGVSTSGAEQRVERSDEQRRETHPGMRWRKPEIAPVSWFTGKEEDVEVGLAYFGKRFYSPNLNRWMNPDPLGLEEPGKADLNVYAYVKGQVLKATDPFGLDGEPANDNQSGLDSDAFCAQLAELENARTTTPDAGPLDATSGSSGSFDLESAKQAQLASFTNPDDYFTQFHEQWSRSLGSQAEHQLEGLYSPAKEEFRSFMVDVRQETRGYGGFELVPWGTDRSYAQQFEKWSAGVTELTPGKSYHQFGAAMDFGLKDLTGDVQWVGTDKKTGQPAISGSGAGFLEKVNEIAQEHGITWLGRVTPAHPEHFEFTNGRSPRQMEIDYLRGNNPITGEPMTLPRSPDFGLKVE